MFTFAMLIDGYEDCEVIAAPRGHIMLDTLLIDVDNTMPISELGINPVHSRALFFGNFEKCQAFLSCNPDSYACAFSSENLLSTLSEDASSRCFLIRICDPGKFFMHIQAVVARYTLWQEHMKNSLLQNMSYQNLIDCSESILGNFLSITDMSFRLLGYTHNIKPDDEVSKRLIQSGYHDKQTIELFRQNHLFEIWETHSGLAVHEVPLTSDSESASYVFRKQGMYFVHVILRFNHKPRTQALLDIFEIFISHLEVLVKRDWQKRRGQRTNYAQILTELLSGKRTKTTTIDEELNLVGIDSDAKFIVLVFAPGEHADRMPASERHYLLSQMEEEFPDQMIIEYEDNIVMVFQLPLQKAIDGNFSDRQAEFIARVSSFISINNKICGCSNTIDSAFDLCFAYQQACFALSCSSKPLVAPTEKASSFVTQFSECYLDFLMFGRLNNKRLDQFCRMHGLVARIIHDDRIEETNNLEIIVTYLYYERRASDAAKALFMHRNTLVYRINALCKRYDLKLDSYASRQALLLEYNIMQNFERL